jgi:hypothetical protein
MKPGDTVEVLTPGALFPKDVLGKVDRIAGERVVVCFPGNWRIYYLPDELRVIEPKTAASGGL